MSANRNVGIHAFIPAIAALLAVLALLTGGAQYALAAESGSCGVGDDAVTYVLDDNGELVISGEGALQSQSFMGRSDIKRAVVEKGVTSIGDMCFAGCQALESIDIPAGVTTIGDQAFTECQALESIDIPAGVKTIGIQAFFNCIGLKSAMLPTTLTTIGAYAFQGCMQLPSISIPAGVTDIGTEAFSMCISLQGVTIPASTTNIGKDAFKYCPNATISVDLGNTVYDSRGDCGALIETQANTLVAASANSSIPDTVTGIGEAAFAEPPGLAQWLQVLGLDITYQQLTSIQIPASVTSIGASAFSGCQSLAAVDIPENTTSIGSYAFQNCESLQALAIPTSVTSIGAGAFSGTTVAVDYAGSSAMWQTITGGESGAVPAGYGLISVVFNSNGGTDVAMQELAPGETATLPDPEPTRENCRFGGWYADESLETPFDFNAPITADITVYAKWRTLSIDGDAYAKFDTGTGTLTFFRSTDVYDTDQKKTYTDGDGLGQTITYYAGVETTDWPAEMSGSPRWGNEREKLVLVVFEDEIAPISTALWFYDLGNLEAIEGMQKLDTSNVANMCRMFGGCQKLSELDLSGFDTSLAHENMSNLFEGCSHLKAVKLGEKTAFAPNFGMPASNWQLASLGEAPVRYDDLGAYDGANPGWYLQGYGDLTIGGLADTVYTGAAITPGLTVSVGERMLEQDVDYTVSYANNTDVGTATVTVAGIDKWTGSSGASFTIAVKKVTPAITLSQAEFTYNGSDQTPGVTVKDGKDTLVAGKDYDVAYPDGCKDVGSHTVKVTCKGNYAGTASASFKIVPREAGPTIVLSPAKFTYDGKAKRPKVAVKNGETVLTADKDYDVSFPEGCEDAGTYTVKVACKGSYTGSANASFTIAKAKNTLVAKGKKPQVSASKLKSKSVKIVCKKALKVGKAKGMKSYKLVKVSKKKFKKYFKVNKKNGAITVKKGLAAGTYKVKVKVKAAGNKNYKPKAKTVTVTVRVA